MSGYLKLKPSFKKAWIKALRGKTDVEYVQTDGALCKPPFEWEKFDPDTRTFNNIDTWGFCCLGVGCDVMTRKGMTIANSPLMFDGIEWFYEVTEYDETVRNFLNEGEWDRKVRIAVNMDLEAMKHLIEMNDSDKPFSEIADWIEENL